MNGRSHNVTTTQVKTPARSGTRKRRATTETAKKATSSSTTDCPPPPPQPRRRRRYKRRDMKRSICEPLKNISYKPGTIVYLKEGVVNRAGTFLPWDTLTFDGKPLFPKPYPGPYPHVISEDELSEYPLTPLESKKPSDDFLLDDESRVLGVEDRTLGMAEHGEFKVVPEHGELKAPKLEPEAEFVFPTMPVYAKMEPEEIEPMSWFTEAEKSVIFSLNLDSSDLSQLKQEFYARALSRSLQKSLGGSPQMQTKGSSFFLSSHDPFFPLLPLPS
eukprot:TRINITY_DN4276_c0_g1_i4.p1 TRINITY_DN4276_c0_g1~~TRINITY_DN4276_c0_g1_i4.p1  ORF type:complete len:274 (+),score=15.34 TRINITY_DN4276_c0_g1_i4:113-934(+)